MFFYVSNGKYRCIIHYEHNNNFSYNFYYKVDYHVHNGKCGIVIDT